MHTAPYDQSIGLVLAALLAAGAVHAQDDAAAGLQIMLDRSAGNCGACHALPGTANSGSNFGPALDHVGSRHDAAALNQWVSDARVIRPDTLMPPFGTTQGTQQSVVSMPILTSEQIARVVAALQSWR